MTAPVDQFEFINEQAPAAGQVNVLGAPENPIALQPPQQAYPEPLIDIPPEQLDEIKIFLDQRIQELRGAWAKKDQEWGEQEKAYRALPEGTKSFPFQGADPTVVPVIAMAVDPVHARLDTGVFKQNPVYTFLPLKKSVKQSVNALGKWVQFYQHNILKLRQVASPRLLECTKLGTCVFKTVFHRERMTTKTYDDAFEVVDRTVESFRGPKVFGISISDLMFDPGYQHLQQCPMVVERQRTTFAALKRAELSGLLANVDELEKQEITTRTSTETAREEATGVTATIVPHDIEVFEVWFDYVLNKKPVKLVATYQLVTRTLHQLRFNWYFHQRYPYTVIPYMVTNDSILGIGIAEMTRPFQDIITRFQQMSSDNAYLANIRMFIAKTDSIEDHPRLYAGRVFYVDKPKEDLIPFGAAEIYPSTIIERQNLFGMAEKRTGVSDYLVGRESPAIGTKATATGTLALIREGLARVEEVLENVRTGFAEVMENCIYIWIQYGLGDTKDLVFGDDNIGEELDNFFRAVSKENVGGAVAINLTATDAATAPQAMQAMQLQIIQVMMQYLEKVLVAGQMAVAARQQGIPDLEEMIKEVMRVARVMFTDLMNKFDVPNPEEYIPDLERFLNAGAAGGEGGAGGIAGQPGAVAGQPGIPGAAGPAALPVVPQSAELGAGGDPATALSLAGGR